MIEIYLDAIADGFITIEDVPPRWRNKVKKILDDKVKKGEEPIESVLSDGS